jgi:hypothetical protein
VLSGYTPPLLGRVLRCRVAERPRARSNALVLGGDFLGDDVPTATGPVN